MNDVEKFRKHRSGLLHLRKKQKSVKKVEQLSIPPHHNNTTTPMKTMQMKAANKQAPPRIRLL